MLYFLTGAIILFFFVLACRCIKTPLRPRLWNCLFPCTIWVLYLLLLHSIYRDVGWADWNFQNAMPYANISPFMFGILPLLLCMPKAIKEHFYLLISLLNVGMLVSPLCGCIYNAAIAYAFHPHFLLNYFAHLLMAIWGIYLYKARDTAPKKSNLLISYGMICGVAMLMLVLNLFLDTSFFGLSLNGKHNIYNNVLTKSGYASALLYFSGLLGILTAGYGLIQWICKKPSFAASK